jgi:molybdate transport system substrate-binding protein
MKRVKFFLVALILLTAFLRQSEAQSGKILIAAASDLKFALDSVIAVYSKENKVTIDVMYGSSGKLFEQLSNGAPFDIFFSADTNYPRLLKEKGLVESEIYSYGVGRIVVWSKKIDPTLEGMNSLLSSSVKKIAMANPLHAPYGKRAEESMNHYKILDKVRSKLVYGENISQVAQFVVTGTADIGIIALSLALSPNMVKEGGKYYLIPESSHSALEQGAVIIKRGEENSNTRKFMIFLKSEKAIEILTKFGFTKP